MMNHILGIGRSGLNANQKKMDALSDHIANVSTGGYKKKEVQFRELLSNEEQSAGVKSGVLKVDYSQGVLRETGYPYDLAIEGEGFFGLTDENGNVFLTRGGAFQLSQDGLLTDKEGNRLIIQQQGNLQEMDTATHEIPLFTVENLQSLIHLGMGRYIPGEGAVVINSFENPDAFGKIQTGFLEESNTDLTKAFTEMITTQRAYTLNTRTLQSTDEIMRLVNEMKR
jgi:flagellar basal-body rod protein FlgG